MNFNIKKYIELDIFPENTYADWFKKFGVTDKSVELCMEMAMRKIEKSIYFHRIVTLPVDYDSLILKMDELKLKPSAYDVDLDDQVFRNKLWMASYSAHLKIYNSYGIIKGDTNI